MSELIGVWVNCRSEEEAARIAQEAVKRRLAACSNIYAPIVSSYHWRGRIENVREVPLLLKTSSSLFGELAQLIEKMHSYETPGIIGIAANHVNTAYKEWVVNETKGAVD
jgi:periplasmic divalent cation tolerance protein